MAAQFDKICSNSSIRLLYLLNLLHFREFSRLEIINEFKKKKINISKTTVLKYISKLEKQNIKINKIKKAKTYYYSIPKENNVNLEKNELAALQDVKKIFITNKDIEDIKIAMKLFYKFALNIKNIQTRAEVVNFDYFSKLNMALVSKLQEHCQNKDIILIDYIMSDNTNKEIEIHVDMLSIENYSHRLYLNGIFKGHKKFSKLPVDRIFMIIKTIEKKARFNLELPVITYRVSYDSYKKIPLDKKEIILEKNKNFVTVQRPIDDTFYIVQRLFCFCPDLYYISDLNIKNLLRQKLLILKDKYEKKY